MSGKPKKLPGHTRVVIFTTAPSATYHRKTINDDADPKEKKSVKDSPLDLKTRTSLTVYILKTLNGMYITGPSNSLTTVMDQHYQTKEKEDQ